MIFLVFIYIVVFIFSFAIRMDPYSFENDDFGTVFAKSLFWPILFLFYLIAAFIKIMKLSFTVITKAIKE